MSSKVNKPCHNCNKDISYYAGFCYHCDKKLEYVRAVGREVKIGGGYMDKKTEEKLEDGTVIKRSYSRGIFPGPSDINQTIIEPDGTIIEQHWLGEWQKHILSMAKIKKTDNKYKYMDWYEWAINDDYIYLSEKHLTKSDIDGVNGPNKGERIDSDKTSFYINSGTPPKISLNIIIKDSKCISGALYSRSGELLYSIVDGNGYIFDGDDTLYYCVNGQLNTLFRGHGDRSEFERHMKIIQEQENQLAVSKRKTAYYGGIEELRKDFNPKKYNKDCPDCFETIKLPAKICHFCKMQFSSDEVELAIDKKFREIYPEP